MATARHQERVEAIQRALRESGTAEGWLFYDFRGSDPLAYRILLLDPARLLLFLADGIRPQGRGGLEHEQRSDYQKKGRFNEEDREFPPFPLNLTNHAIPPCLTILRYYCR